MESGVALVLGFAIMMATAAVVVATASVLPMLVDRALERQQDHRNGTDRCCAMAMSIATVAFVISLFCVAIALNSLS